MTDSMKVGILGAGAVGESLGKALIKAGHQVMFSSRDPHGDHARRVATETGASVGLPDEVLAFSHIVAIAMPPDAVNQLAKAYAGQWRDKIVIDMNNRFGPGASGTSFAQELAALTGGKVVKAFNTIGAEHYQNPVFAGQSATMFIAGDDAEAKRVVGQLAVDIGFEVIDAGSLDAAVHVENLARFWVHLVRLGQGREIAFKLLKR